MRLSAIVWTLTFFATTSCFGETTFIKDQLNVTVYSQNPSNGIVADATETTLSSGVAVEVLLNDGRYSKIRHKEIEGWVESEQLTREKPQKIRYLQLLSKHKTLTQELDVAKSKLGQMKETEKEAMALGKLNQELVLAREKILALETKLTTMETNSTTLEANPNPSQNPALRSIPLTWAGGGMVLSLLLGLYLGYTLLDRAIRKRHGGIRIR